MKIEVKAESFTIQQRLITTTLVTRHVDILTKEKEALLFHMWL